LDATKVDVPDQGSRRGPVDVVLDQDVVLQYGDLGKILALSDDHLAHYRFAPGEELRLAQHRRTPPTCFSTLPSTLPLGLHAGRTIDTDYFCAGALAWLTHPKDGIRRVVGGCVVVLPTTPTTATPSAGAFPIDLSLALDVCRFLLFALPKLDGPSLDGSSLRGCTLGGRAVLTAGASPPTTTATPTPPTALVLARLALGRQLLGSLAFSDQLIGCWSRELL
jgi:hypothetical protein